MTVFEVTACLLVLAAIFSYLNHTLLKLPPAIALMAMSLAGSLVLVLVGIAVASVEEKARAFVHEIDLDKAFLHGMLDFMLFAGALHIKLEELAARKWTVLLLSTIGVLISTVVVGLLAWGLLSAVGIPARPIYCFLFGALISPTDPIAVMAILRQAGVPKGMEIKIAGVSRFSTTASASRSSSASSRSRPERPALIRSILPASFFGKPLAAPRWVSRSGDWLRRGSGKAEVSPK